MTSLRIGRQDCSKAAVCQGLCLRRRTCPSVRHRHQCRPGPDLHNRTQVNVAASTAENDIHMCTYVINYAFCAHDKQRYMLSSGCETRCTVTLRDCCHKVLYSCKPALWIEIWRLHSSQRCFGHTDDLAPGRPGHSSAARRKHLSPH